LENCFQEVIARPRLNLSRPSNLAKDCQVQVPYLIGDKGEPNVFPAVSTRHKQWS